MAKTSPPNDEGRLELLQGTLDMLVLKALQLGDLHGWGITERIEQGSRQALQLNQGSLYPALYRLEEQGWISAEWGISDEGRRAKFYTLTAHGKKQLAEEQASWRMFAKAVEQVLAT